MRKKGAWPNLQALIIYSINHTADQNFMCSLYIFPVYAYCRMDNKAQAKAVFIVGAAFLVYLCSLIFASQGPASNYLYLSIRRVKDG